MADNRLRFLATLDDKVSGKIAKIRDNFDQVGKSKGFKALMQGVGLGAGAAAFNAIGQAASAAGDYIGDSIQAASDLAESMNKSKVIFGTSAKGIEAWGSTTADALGISKQAAIEAAATFGNFFTGLGKSEGQAAEMSKRVVTLAADLASFNNMDPTEALDKLRAGLAGEAEPLRRLGVFLSEAKVKAKAMELGLADAHGELTEGAKVQARYALILEETTTAQGDFARTSDDLANAQRRLKAQVEDSKAALGEQLLPAEKAVVDMQRQLFDGLAVIGQSLRSEITPGTLASARMFGRLTDEELKTELAALRVRDAMKYMADAAKDDLRPSLNKAADATAELGDEADEAKKSVGEMADSVVDDARKLLDDYYDPIIARDELTANKVELNAARRVLAEHGANTAIGREAKATIHRIEKDNIELGLELMAAGKLNAKEQAALLADLKSKLKSSSGAGRTAIQGLIDKFMELSRLEARGFTLRFMSDAKKDDVHRAAGGPVAAYQTYTVGEQGPETLVMGSQSGTIIPNGGGGGGITVNYSPMFSSASPNEARQMVRSIIPELQRELARQRA